MNLYDTVIGIDVGGTFTDLYLTREDGTTKVCKVPSTPNDPSEGLMAALLGSGAAPHDVNLIVHGTTIATNAVIERKGAKVALITTRGFRDVLELGRRDRPNTPKIGPCSAAAPHGAAREAARLQPLGQHNRLWLFFQT